MFFPTLSEGHFIPKDCPKVLFNTKGFLLLDMSMGRSQVENVEPSPNKPNKNQPILQPL
ncbi:hypothetical protein Fmac_027327 [Flemingia macrophylla]|uniref:Uncharacterized protein n=1 Tax=Flemingia macrophylla TaxID=520843 RepID=A0ABD1LHC9_9FABA